MAGKQSTKSSQNLPSSQNAKAKKTIKKVETEAIEGEVIPPIAKKAPAKPKRDRRKARKASPRKYDPVAMFEWYCGDMTRTYQDVAEHFNASKSYISRLAAKEDTTWLERRLKVMEKMERKAGKRRYREATERDDIHLKSLRAAITVNTNTILREGKKKVDQDVNAIAKSTNALHKAIMGERVIMGLPVLIARSEIMHDDDDVPTLRDAHLTAKRMAERAKELEDMRNNG